MKKIIDPETGHIGEVADHISDKIIIEMGRMPYHLPDMEIIDPIEEVQVKNKTIIKPKK